MNKILKSFNISNLFTIIFFTTIFAIVLYLILGSVLCGDDIYFEFLFGGIKLKKNFVYGTWVMQSINIVLYYIPYKLHINIQDWNALFGCILKTSIVTTIFIYLYKFLKYLKLNTKLSLITVSIMFSLFWILQSNINFVDFIITQGFYRFIFVALLYEIFLYYCFKVFNGEEIKLAYLAGLSFIVASSSETIGLISGITIFFLLLISLLENRKEIKITNLKIFFTLFSFVILGFFCLSLTIGFQDNLNYKLGNYTISIVQIIKSIPEYSIIYIKQFIPILPYIAIIALSSIFALLRNKNNTKRNIIFIVVILLSLFIYTYSFILLGKTSYDKDYWILHVDLYSIVYIITIIMLTLSIGVAISTIEITKKTIICLFIILISLLIPTYNACCILKGTLDNIRFLSYLRDKIRLYYRYKDIPNSLPQFSKFMMFKYCTSKDKIDPYKNIYVTILRTYETEDEIGEQMGKDYYSTLYNAEINEKNKTVNIADMNEIALDYYTKNGGTFDEIYTNKYKFSDLANKDFVLNNNIK